MTDIEIAERARQGKGGSLRQTSSEVTDRKRYLSRIVSTANQVNLEYNDAVPALTSGLVRSISGMF